VPGANRTYVHRSHSGRYGLVNSEEGYQSLRRFLFGDLRVDADLTGYQLPADPASGPVTWQAEVRLSVRGLPVVLHERLAAHWCPLQLSAQGTDATSDGAVRLATTFLSSELPRPEADTLRFSLQLRVFSLREEHRLFHFMDHLEQIADFDDTLIVDIGRSEGAPAAWAAWNSRIPSAISDYKPQGRPVLDEDPAAGSWITHIPLPSDPATEPAPNRLLGERAAIRLTVTPWG